MENKMRILAVDDNIINLATIEQELKTKYDVITVNSGVRASRYLNKEKPDLILLDVQMALMDGIETLKELRKINAYYKEVPVIALTGNYSTTARAEYISLGFDDYLEKPIIIDSLDDILHKYL